MATEIFDLSDSLKMVDFCLHNYRQSQLEQLFDQECDVIINQEVSVAVLFVGHHELADFVLHIAGHNVYGLSCFQQFGFKLSGLKRGQNSIFRVKISLGKSEHYLSFDQVSIRAIFSENVSQCAGVKRPRWLRRAVQVKVCLAWPRNITTKHLS